MEYYNKIKALVEHELDDYSYFEGWKISLENNESDEYEYYLLSTRCNDVEFRVNDKKIEVRITEDVYQEVIWFESSIKYFWMSLLNWDQ